MHSFNGLETHLQETIRDITKRRNLKRESDKDIRSDDLNREFLSSPIQEDASDGGSLDTLQPGAYLTIGGLNGADEDRGILDEEERNIDYLKFVSVFMKKSFYFEPTDGSIKLSNVPAGFTYLFQLSIHDITINSNMFPIYGSTTTARNLRSERLFLETVYGLGPGPSNPIYELSERARRERQSAHSFPRTVLRLDGVRRNESNNGTESENHTCPFFHNNSTDTDPKRDIGRALEVRGNQIISTALIADNRNDDNAILSQLVALFHLAHNTMIEKLESAHSGEKISAADAVGYFHDARLMMVFIYRQIIVYDLLPRILHEDIYKEIFTDFLGEGGEKEPSNGATKADVFKSSIRNDRVTKEFAHVAGRVGHAMVRNQYDISEGLMNQNLDIVLNANSSNLSVDVDSGEIEDFHVPFVKKWILDWALFFEFENSSGQQRVQMARRFEPGYANFLFSNDIFSSPDDDGTGGLPFRDLARSITDDVQTVRTMIRDWGNEYSNIKKNHPVWFEEDYVSTKMSKWIDVILKKYEDIGEDYSSEDKKIFLKEMRNNPPPILFCLCEGLEDSSLKGADGNKLGPITSLIIAHTYASIIQSDISLFRTNRNKNKINIIKKNIFDNEDIPRNIAELIAWIQNKIDKKHLTYREKEDLNLYSVTA